MITLSYEQWFPYWLANEAIFRGRALAEQGQGEEGIAQMRQGIAAWHAAGTELNRPYFLALLAEAHRKAGQVEEGLTTLAEALTAVNRTGERYYEAELYRLKGELTLKKTVDRRRSAVVEKEAEACFQKAIEIARRQQAKSLELRATMSLARLWHEQGKTKPARKMLAKIYGWFTEGFDTVDLKEARALLEELERHRS